MKEEDKAHIELLCRRHNIKWLNEAERIAHLKESKNYDLLFSGSSFSSQLVHQITGQVMECMIYVNPTDSDDFGEGIVDDSDKAEEENEYFVALHEIGHCMLGHRNHNHTLGIEPPREVIEQNEMDAWEWAFTHANYWPSDDTVIRSLCALSTYTHDEHRQRMRARGELKKAPDPWQDLIAILAGLPNAA